MYKDDTAVVLILRFAVAVVVVVVVDDGLRAGMLAALVASLAGRETTGVTLAFILKLPVVASVPLC